MFCQSHELVVTVVALLLVEHSAFLEDVTSASLCLLISGAAAESMLGSLLCLPGSGSVLLDPYGSTISETTSEAWSVEVLPSDSGGPAGLFCCSTHVLLWLLCHLLCFSSTTASDVCLNAHVCFFTIVGGWDTRCDGAAFHTRNTCMHLSSYLCALACLSGQICPCQ